MDDERVLTNLNQTRQEPDRDPFLFVYPFDPYTNVIKVSAVTQGCAVSLYSAGREAGPYSLIARNRGGDCFVDRNLSSGGIRFYFAELSCGGISRWTQVTCAQSPSDPVIGLKVQDYINGELLVSWSSPAGEKYSCRLYECGAAQAGSRLVYEGECSSCAVVCPRPGGDGCFELAFTDSCGLTRVRRVRAPSCPRSCDGILLSCTDADNRASLSWTYAGGGEDWCVMRSCGPNGCWTPVARTRRRVWTDPDAPEGVQVRYRVFSFGGDCDAGASSNTVETELSPSGGTVPLAPGVESMGVDSCRISWVSAGENALYRVYRSSDGGPFCLVRETSQTVFTDSGLSGTESCVYRVCTVSGGEESAPLTFPYPAAQRPKAPGNLCACPLSAGVVRLAWQADEGSSPEYLIARAPKDDPGTFTFLGSTMSCSFTDMTPCSGTAYTYSVFSRRGGLLSAGPARTFAVTPSKRPAPPELELENNCGTDGARLSWRCSGGADCYAVQRKDEGCGEFVTVAFCFSCSFCDRALQGNQSCSYRVLVCSCGSVSAASNTCAFTGICASSSFLETVRVGEGTVFCSWDGGELSDEWSVCRAASPDGPFVKIGESRAGAFVDACGEAPCYYRVSCTGQNGRTVCSAVSCPDYSGSPSGEPEPNRNVFYYGISDIALFECRLPSNGTSDPADAHGTVS